MASYSDDFAGSGALSANWVSSQDSVGNLTRSSGVLRALSNSWTGVRHQGLLATDNQFVQATVASNGWANSGTSHQIWARVHNGAITGYEQDFYAAIIDTQGVQTTPATYGTFREQNGSYSQIVYLTGYSIVATGEVMRMGIEGLLVFLYRNGTIVGSYPILNRDVLPDSDHRRAGISLAVNSDLTTIGLDDWSCGDIATPTYAPSDDFNRANSTGGLGSITWFTTGNAFSAMVVNGNAARGENGGAQCCAFWTAWAPRADQWSEITIKTTASTGTDGLGPCVRVNPSPNQNDFYYIKAGVNIFEIWKMWGGTRYAVHTGNTTNCAVGDVVRLEAEGTTLRALRNGSVVITATDSTLTVGLWGITTSAATLTNSTIDAWAGGEIALVDSAATAPARTGTASQLDGSAGDGSTSVTVPAGCNYVVAFWTFWNNASGSSLSSLTLGGSPFTIYRQTGDVPNASCVGIAGLVSPATGTQTAAWNWASNVAVAQGGKIILVYATGADTTDPVRETQSTGEGGNPGAVPPMIAIDSKSTDLVLAFGQGYETNVGLDGTAFIDGSVLNHLYYDATQVTAAYPRTTVTMTNPAYSTIAAISIKGVAAAAATGNPWHTYSAMMGA